MNESFLKCGGALAAQSPKFLRGLRLCTRGSSWSFVRNPTTRNAIVEIWSRRRRRGPPPHGIENALAAQPQPYSFRMA